MSRLIGRHGGAPVQFHFRFLQPFGVLVEHGIDDVNEGFVGGEEAVAAGENVAFEPAFEGVLAEHLHDAAGKVELAAVGVFRFVLREPGFFRSGVNGREAVRGGLVGAEDAEGIHIAAHDFGKKMAKDVGGRGVQGAGRFYVEGEVAKIRKVELFAQQTAVGVRIGGNAARAGRGKFLQFGDEGALGVEEFFGFVAAHPVFHDFQALRIGHGIENGNLVSAPEIFHLVAVDFFWSGPSFGRTKNDHGPARTSGVVLGAGVLLQGTNLQDALLESGGHLLMHCGGIMAFDEIRFVAVAD